MTMHHGPYEALIQFEEEENSFYGRVVNLARDGFDFWGRDVDELRAELVRSAEEYEAFCRERGEEPEKPFSGTFLVRGSPELHRAVAVAAARNNTSMNAFVTDALAKAVNG